jgi:hypothetical protein
MFLVIQLIYLVVTQVTNSLQFYVKITEFKYLCAVFCLNVFMCVICLLSYCSTIATG